MRDGWDRTTQLGGQINQAHNCEIRRPGNARRVFHNCASADKINKSWGCSSAGRAPRSQRGGQRFDPAQLHQYSPASMHNPFDLTPRAFRGVFCWLCGRNWRRQQGNRIAKYGKFCFERARLHRLRKLSCCQVLCQGTTLLIRPINTDNWVPHPSRVLCGMGGIARHYLREGSIVVPIEAKTNFRLYRLRKNSISLGFVTRARL